MRTSPLSFTHLSDDELLAEVQRLAAKERQATATLIRSLMELDARRLYLAAGYSSLFAFCTRVLHLSEHAAQSRIEVARASRRQPRLVAAIDEGSINVTCARLLAPHLTDENCEALLASARHKTKREVEEIIVRLRPLPSVPSRVRKLPTPHTSRSAASSIDRSTAAKPPGLATERGETAAAATSAPVSASPRPIVAPVAPERYKVQFTISSETRQKLRRVQDLLRHSVPSGDPAAIFDRALSALINQLERSQLASTDKPRESAGCAAGSRHVPAAVRRAVWARDGGQCAFLGSHGRCAERGFLELHHLDPFAAGGPATVDNIQLRCAAHNRYEAFLFFGDKGAGQVREHHEPWDRETSRTLRARSGTSKLGRTACRRHPVCSRTDSRRPTTAEEQHTTESRMVLSS
jgi:5-methylcytosine-specific restriction endonuclease McrA